MDEITKSSFNKLQQIRTSIQRMEDAKNQPHIKQLCGMIWQTNELHVLFADTGVGKSLLAVSIVDAITKGTRILNLENEHPALPAIYYDFELSDRQYKKRYSNEAGAEYPFSETFYIDSINFAELYEVYEKTSLMEMLLGRIRYDLEKTGAKVLVLDNITYLNTQSTQDTQIALEVMRGLNEIKKEFDISILILAHTPKRFNNTPISLIDLAGSKHLSNFADSVSAIGRSSQGNNIRYWKQVKPSRSGELIFDTDNVLVMKIVKHDTFLTMEFVDYESEYDHLIQETGNKETGNKETPAAVFKVAKLLKDELSYENIAKQLGISKGTITKWKNKYPELFVSVSNVSEEGPSGNMETLNIEN